jgi:lysophospholipase
MSKLQYDPSYVAVMIANDNLIGTENGHENWLTYLGCAIVKKTGNTLTCPCRAMLHRLLLQLVEISMT